MSIRLHPISSAYIVASGLIDSGTSTESFAFTRIPTAFQAGGT